jgi:GNAT superfamily N-acetyltransferase
VADMAAIEQSSLTMTPLGELRYGKVPALELKTWLEACYQVELRADLKTPRITGFDVDEFGQDVTRTEFLVIRDLDLKSLGALRDDSGSERTNGRIVAYAEFRYHPPGQASVEKQEPQASTEASDPDWRSLQPPSSVHRVLREHWNNVVEAALAAQFGGMNCFEVRSLSTLSPSHLRKGIASKLLSWLLPWADRLKVPVVLAATPPGYPLYLKHGFVEVGSNEGAIECDMARWGGSGIHRHVLMMRWPNKGDD